MKKTDKYDQLVLGLILGTILPMLAFIITWLIAEGGSLGDYIQRFQKMGRVSSLISLSAIPNLLLFFIFIWLNKYKSARGVIFATFLLAFAMLIVKFT